MIEVLKQALEALEQWNTPLYKRGTAIKSLRQAIAELESQEIMAWEHLNAYGYAPGGYMMICRGCNKQVIDVDKRASRCKTCAETAYARDTHPPQRTEQEPVAWIEGYPKAHYAEEWFIAKLNDGDRVVLQALPEEFKHDFTTRDGTYFLKESIKSWMQFPDTEFLPPPQRTWVGIEGEEIRNLWEEATKPDRSTMTMVTSFAKSIEAKLKEKNT